MWGSIIRVMKGDARSLAYTSHKVSIGPTPRVQAHDNRYSGIEV